MSIKKQLPEPYEQVLVYGKLLCSSCTQMRQIPFMVTQAYHVNITCEPQEWVTLLQNNFIYVTHWMPLPEIPKDTNEVD